MKNEIGLFAREIRIHDGYVNPDTPEEPPAMCIAFILSAKNRAITFRFDLMKFVKQREDTLRQMEKTGIYIVDVCSHSLNEEEGDTPAPEGECPYINGKCYSLHQSGSGLQALGILQVLGEEGLWKHLEEKFYSFFNISTPNDRVITTDKYWDCECGYDYIHPKGDDWCEMCGTSEVDCPSSRVCEVAVHLGLTEKEILEVE